MRAVKKTEGRSGGGWRAIAADQAAARFTMGTLWDLAWRMDPGFLEGRDRGEGLLVVGYDECSIGLRREPRTFEVDLALS